MSYSHTNAAILIWPITQQGQMIAQQFAMEQTQPAIAERVRRNTLAVWVMYEFLSALSIPTDLATSDSWNPVLQLTEDVADLVIPGLGRLECRPVLSDDSTVPLEALIERIGYVAIALDETAGEASLLGFVAEISPVQPELRLDQLRTMDDFPDYLQQINQGKTSQESSGLTRLNQWLEGHFENGWQSAEDLLAQYFWMPTFRKGVQLSQQELPTQIERTQQLDLDLRLETEQIVLALEVQQASAAGVDIAIQLYPMGETTYLPEGLNIRVLDEKDSVCLTAHAQPIDDYVRLDFRGCPGQPFTVEVILGNVYITERFIV